MGIFELRVEDLVLSFRQTSWQEWVAAVTGLISVYLGVKNHVWNWFFQIVSSILYTWVFWNSNLLSSSGLNLFYFIPMQLYGWYSWSKFGPQSANRLPISHASLPLLAGGLILSGIFTGGWGWYASTHTQAFLPYLDAGVTGLSIVAEFLDSKKKFENWFVWGVVNFVYAFILLPPQKLYVSAILYFIFLLMAFWGAFEWRKTLRKQTAEAADSTGTHTRF